MLGLVEKIRNIFWGEDEENGNGAAPALRITIKSDSDETISTRIEKAYELQEQYLPPSDNNNSNSPTIAGYLLRKQLVGSCCEQPVYITVHFDADKRPSDHSVTGGEWISAEECS